MKNKKRKWSSAPQLDGQSDLSWSRTDVITVGDNELQRQIVMMTTLNQCVTRAWKVRVAYMDVDQAAAPQPKTRHIRWSAGAPTAREALAGYAPSQRGVPPEIIKAVQSMGPPSSKVVKTITIDGAASNYPRSGQ